MSSCLPERCRFQRAAVEWLRKLGYWGDEKSIRARMDEVRRSFDATDYSYHLEEDFDQSLIYFLSAVEHLKAQGRESESLAETVGRYVVGMSSSFESAGLLELVRHELREVIDALTSDYSASSSRLSQLEGAPGPEPGAGSISGIASIQACRARDLRASIRCMDRITRVGRCLCSLCRPNDPDKGGADESWTLYEFPNPEACVRSGESGGQVEGCVSQDEVRVFGCSYRSHRRVVRFGHRS